jgi:epoxyqueuosine reductase
MATMMELSEFVGEAALGAGFDLAGVAAVRDTDFPELARFPEWIASGHAGEMEYLKSRDEQGRLRRAALRNALPWARSVIVCAKSYDTAHPLSTACGEADRGWISRYAWSRDDYHDSMLARLRQVEARLREKHAARAGTGTLETRCYVDTGPLVERVYARHAGIGWIGKNTCVINQRRGSFVFLGVILTSLDLEPSLPAADRCGTCTRCIDACPTQAIVAPGELDSRLCIAYLTIEKRGEIPEELRAGVGRHVFGCDICQDVCPWNTKARRENRAELPEASRPELVNPALEWLASLDDAALRALTRRTPLARAKRSGLRRNIAVAMGNAGDRRFEPALEKLAEDADPVVAEHARWGLQRLSTSSDANY